MSHGEVEPVWPTTSEVVTYLAVGSAGMAGPAGPLIAAAVGLAFLTADRMDRARQAALIAIEEAGGQDELIDRLHSDEELQVLVIDAIEIASRTADVRKRKLAGRAVGRAARDSALIDPAHLITRALRNLDMPHLRALAEIRRLELAQGGEPVFPSETEFGSDEHARAKAVVLRVGHYTKGLPEPIRAQMLGEGVVREGDTVGNVNMVVGTSVFGRQLLEELEEEVAG